MKKTYSFLLLIVMLISLVSCAGEGETSKTPTGNLFANDTFTYYDYITAFPVNFGPFGAETDEEEYILSLTQTGLYAYEKNSEGNGYLTVPAFAEGLPADVTASYGALAHWFIPSDASDSYAYRVKLNQNACWQDGTPINADTYIYSMKALLEGDYSASELFSTGELALVKAYEYQNRHKAGQPIYVDNTVEGEYIHPFDTWIKGADGVYTAEGIRLVFSLDSPLSAMNGYSIQGWHTESGGTDFAACLPELRKLADQDGFVPVTDTSINLMYSFTGSDAWGSQSKSELASYIYYANGFYDNAVWADVGLEKNGEYEITFVFKNPVDIQTFKSRLTRSFLVKEDVFEKAGAAYGTDMEKYASSGPYKISTYASGRLIILETNERWYGVGVRKGEYQATTVNITLMTNAQALEEFKKGNLDRVSLAPADLGLYENSDSLVLTPEKYTTGLCFNGDINSLKSRESYGVNKSILAYKDFRKALSLCVDRDAFCKTLTACNIPAYGIVNQTFVSNPETGASYRDNFYAKAALCSFYGVNNMDDINGYDKETASELFEQAYLRAKEDGNISDTDKVSLALSVSEGNEANRQIVSFLNDAISQAVEGTSLENRVEITLKADKNYYESCKNGNTDIIISTWSGDKFSLLSVLDDFCDNDTHYQYGFDAEQEMVTVSVSGDSVTLSFYDWYQSLTSGEYAHASRDIRVGIMAEMEKGILSRYFVTPLYAHCSPSLISEKITLGCQSYTAALGYGGIQYLMFNYTDEQYAARGK